MTAQTTVVDTSCQLDEFQHAPAKTLLTHLAVSIKVELIKAKNQINETADLLMQFPGSVARNLAKVFIEGNPLSSFHVAHRTADTTVGANNNTLCCATSPPDELTSQIAAAGAKKFDVLRFQGNSF